MSCHVFFIDDIPSELNTLQPKRSLSSFFPKCSDFICTNFRPLAPAITKSSFPSQNFSLIFSMFFSFSVYIPCGGNTGKPGSPQSPFTSPSYFPSSNRAPTKQDATQPIFANFIYLLQVSLFDGC